MKSFADVVAACRTGAARRLAVAGPIGAELSDALADAERLGIAITAVQGPPAVAVRAVRDGAADLLLKGDVETSTFMRAVLDPEGGLRSGALLSHVLVVEYGGRLLLMTDGGIVPNPGQAELRAIIANALPIAASLGIARPRVALLAAIEHENPRMPETVVAAAISREGITGCFVQGPLALDLATSPEAALAKRIGGEVAGRADILVVPSVLVGNILGKALVHMAGCPAGGVVAGTSRPVTFLSRSDSSETKLHSICLGLLAGRREQP